jgi:hypothetical protein
VVPSLKNYFLQKAFCVFNYLLNMIVFDKSPNGRSFCLWLTCGAPKWTIFGAVVVSVQSLAAKQPHLLRCRCEPPRIVSF